MIIKFNLESDPEARFFALYAGLRMYQEQKEKTTPKDQISVAAAEAYSMRQEMKEKHPKKYQEAEEEFNSVYGNLNKIK